MRLKTGVAVSFFATAQLASAQQAIKPQQGMPAPDKNGNVSFIASGSTYSVYGNCRKPRAHVTVFGLNANHQHDHGFVGTNAFGDTVPEIKIGENIYKIGDFCRDNGSLNIRNIKRAFQDISKATEKVQPDYPPLKAASSPAEELKK